MKKKTPQVAGKNENAAHPERGYRIPPVDIIEKENEYLIEADMPGTSESNVEVQFRHGELEITAKACEHCSKADGKHCEKNYRIRQFEPRGYYRSFRLGDSINTESISAEYKNGVLTVLLPKAEQVKPRRIEVQKK